jgi:hypothetical protein
MPESTETHVSADAKPKPRTRTQTTKAKAANGAAASNGNDYVLPILHTHIPSRVVNIGFWAGLGGAVAVGVIDPPIGIVVGAGVLVAHHQRSNGSH